VSNRGLSSGPQDAGQPTLLWCQSKRKRITYKTGGECVDLTTAQPVAWQATANNYSPMPMSIKKDVGGG